MEYNNQDRQQNNGFDNPDEASVEPNGTQPQTDNTDNPEQENTAVDGTDAEEGKPYTPRQVYKIQRPPLLSVLCVLTFIGSGVSAFSSIVTWLSLPMLKETASTTDIMDSFFSLMPDLETQFMAFLEIPPYFFLISALFYIGSVIGAAWMWRLQRKGFHVYTISQCVLILLSMLMIPSQGIPWGNIFWTGLFVALYAINMKYMNPQQK